jgi:Na+-transporting NADH:ubiquinone oxidoreductase subunit NqrF
VFYEEYFEHLAQKHLNFSFGVALSSPLPEDEWTGPVGFIHEVVLRDYLSRHSNPGSVEYYLCGPPLMIKACLKMLADLSVPAGNISYDEF